MNVPSTKSLESATKRGRSSGGRKTPCALKFKPTDIAGFPETACEADYQQVNLMDED
jgi:hypothetical protein